MFRLSIALEKLEQDRAYTYREIFQLWEGMIPPEKALRHYRTTLEGDARTAAIKDPGPAIVSGRRIVITKALGHAVKAGWLVRTGERGAYVWTRPGAAVGIQHPSGIHVDDVKRWFREEAWMSMDRLAAKAEPSAIREKVLEHREARRCKGDEEAKFQAGLRGRIYDMLRTFRRNGFLDERHVPARVEYRLRRFAKGTEAEKSNEPDRGAPDQTEEQRD